MHDVGLIDSLLFRLPLWMIGIILFALCLAARELGGLIHGRWASRKTDQISADGSADNQIIAAIFGLLAFLIGFTFSIAIDRYDNRRALVAEEANAIGTTYLRASLFDEPQRTILQSTLREYAHSRIAPQGVWGDNMEERLRQTTALKLQMWDQTRAALMPIRETEQASYFVETMNHTLDTATLRELAGRLHLPTIIIVVMLLYLIAASAMLGYLLRAWGGGHRWSSAVMIGLFVVVIVLVLDIDRPQGGSIRVSQRAMEELVKQLDQDVARQARAIPLLPQNARASR